MVERQMRASVKMTGDLWFTAWVDAGQPDIRMLIDHKPTAEELREKREALETLKQQRFQMRGHD
jgi:hypothetical protein